MSFKGTQEYDGKASGLATEHAAAVVVFAALGFLVLVRKGFRGIGAPGVGGVSLGR